MAFFTVRHEEKRIGYDPADHDDSMWMHINAHPHVIVEADTIDKAARKYLESIEASHKVTYLTWMNDGSVQVTVFAADGTFIDVIEHINCIH